MSAYDEAVQALYRAPLSDFVTERKRLATELKTAGDKDGSNELGKLARPPVSAWAVNQLWWLERGAFEAFLSAAAKVTIGDRDAARAHRESLADLRELAIRILQDGGNAASDTTLRRVTATLGALAAGGGFAPDPPGALADDRDPPGFEALGFAPSSVRPSAPAPAPAPAPNDDAVKRAAEAEQRRVEEDARRRRAAERERLSAALRGAKEMYDSQHRELSRLRAEVDIAEQRFQQTQALLSEIEAKLASL